jgi:hypothetical protein
LRKTGDANPSNDKSQRAGKRRHEHPADDHGGDSKWKAEEVEKRKVSGTWAVEKLKAKDDNFSV